VSKLRCVTEHAVTVVKILTATDLPCVKRGLAGKNVSKMTYFVSYVAWEVGLTQSVNITN